MLPLGMAALALPLCGAPTASQASAASSGRVALPPAADALLKAGDYAGLQRMLVQELGKDAAALSPDQAQALHLATVLEVIRVTSPEVMAEMHKNPKHAKFLQAFLQDQPWMELYLGAGLVPFKTDVGLAILSDIWNKDGSSSDFGKYKSLACGLASVWGGGETAPSPRLQSMPRTQHNPLWRYEFFKKQAKAGKLYPGFYNLRPWEIRFLVAIPQQDWNDQSLAWCAENFNMPWNRYNGACWAGPYTDPSAFGDGIQGPYFYVPWGDESEAERTKKNGGVCGGLSHLGAFAAMSRGVPAYTVGQPGHCAYAIRLGRGKWIGGFGGPDGGMHNSIFGNQAPTSYLLMENVFADDAKADAGYRHAVVARAQEAAGDRKAAIASWQKALAQVPLHPHFRAELHRLMQLDGATPEQMYDYAIEVLPKYRGNGFAACDAFVELEKAMLPKLSEEKRLAWFDKVHSCIASTPSSWAVKMSEGKPSLLQRQMDLLQSDDAKAKLLASIFANHMREGDGTNFGQALEWGVKELVGKDKADVFATAFAEAAASSAPATGGADAEEKNKKMREAYRKAIVAAEAARSIPAFQALSQAAEKFNTVKEGAVTTTLPGTLEPPTGMIRFSSTCGYDTAEAHRDILTPQGGKVHWDKEKNPTAIAELKEGTDNLSGVIVRKANGNEWRMKKAKLFTSSDGATWFPLAETNDMPKEWVVEAKPGTKAKWVKLEFANEGNGEFAHISHFLIYKR